MRRLLAFLTVLLLSFSAVAGDLVDLNKATPQELAKLPGIGKKKAEAIIEYREKSGGFATVDEVKKVKGIGKATLEKLRPLVTVSAVKKTP